jgi:acetyl esterase/lipase
VILFPGGQFKHLDAIPDAVSKSLTAAGYMVFMTEYRTAPPNKLAGQVSLGRWPDQTNDVELAAAAAKTDSRSNGEVFVVGGSAGASHAAYLAAEGLVKAAVSISPPMQLDDPVSLQNSAFRNDVNNYAPNHLAEASPNALFTSGQPPIFVIAFAQDHIPTPQHTIACSHLDALGASYADLLLPGAGHSWDAWRVSGVPAQVIAFLNAHRSF